MPRKRRLSGGRVLAGPAGELVARDLILSADGRIEAILSPEAPSPEVETVDLRGRVVLPGLVNAHSHAYGQLTRRHTPHARLEAWMPRAQAAARALAPDGHAIAATLNALDNLRHGTTTTLDHATLAEAELEAVVDAYEAVGTRTVLALQVADLQPSAWLPNAMAGHASSFPDAPAASADELVGRTVAGLARIAQAARTTAAVGPSAPERCSDDLLQRLGVVARDHGVPVHVHLLETPLQAAHEDAVGRLARYGLLGDATAVAHAVHLTAADRERLASSGTSIVHDPLCNLLLGSGCADLPAMLDAGIPVGLGTDGWSTGGAQDLIGQSRVALGLPRPTTDEARWPQPTDAWAAMTTGSARAVGLSGVVGAIAVGHQADLLVVDPVRAGWIDGEDAVTQIVWQGLGLGLRRVIVGGDDVLVDGVAVQVDEERVAAEAAQVARRVADAGSTTLADALEAAWHGVLAGASR